MSYMAMHPACECADAQLIVAQVHTRALQLL